MITELAKITKIRELSVVLQNSPKRKLSGVLKKLMSAVSQLPNLEILEIILNDIRLSASEFDDLNLPYLKALHLQLDPGASEYSVIQKFI
jgi:hypothetical protein